MRLVAPYCAIPRDYLQEPRQGAFSRAGCCRVQCHAQGNRKMIKDIGPSSTFGTQSATAMRGVHFLHKPPSKIPLLSAHDISAIPRYCALWGFWCLDNVMVNWVRHPLPLFWALPPLESLRSGGAIPLSKGVSQRCLRGTPMKTRQKCAQYSPVGGKHGSIW